MSIETTPWDAAQFLGSPELIAAYLATYHAEGTFDELLEACRTAARAHGKFAIDSRRVAQPLD